jgi:hypothetical protein
MDVFSEISGIRIIVLIYASREKSLGRGKKPGEYPVQKGCT